MLFEAGFLSRVVGIRLVDDREVIVKVRSWQDRLVASTSLQAGLAAHGFPCPRPLAGPDRVGDDAVSAERMCPVVS